MTKASAFGEIRLDRAKHQITSLQSVKVLAFYEFCDILSLKSFRD